MVRVTAEGEDLFQGVVAGLQGDNRPPWGGWVRDGLQRTRVERGGNGTLYWFRADGNLPNDLPWTPAPGITVYRGGDDVPTETDPATVHDAHLLLGVVLARFVRRLAEGGDDVPTETDPATEPEPRTATEPEPAPEEQRAESAPVGQGQPEPVAAEYPIYQGLTLRVAREPGGWRLAFRHEGRALLTVVEARPPWAGGVQAQRRIVSALGDVLVGDGMPGRDIVGARLLATFATLLEEMGGEGEQPAGEAAPGGPDDVPDPGIVEEAVDVLRHGDPVEHLLATFARYHEGDRDVARALALATACQSIENAAGIHVQLSGEPGSGKSHAVESWLDLLPDRYKIAGSFSDRSLFYADLQIGPMIYIDDQDLSPTLQEVVKIATTHYQRPTQHLTVTTERKPETLTLPPRTCFIFSKVEGVGDDQVLDRCLYAWVDQSEEHQAQVTKKTLELAALPRHLREQNRRAVEVCRAMWDHIRGRTFDVTIPYASRIRFGGLRGRSQNLVLDLIRSFAVLRHEQRPYAVDPETGTVVMDATEQDFRDAVAAFGAFMASCGSQVQKLTPAESRCVNAILAWGATEFTRARLIDAVGLSQQRVHQILHGRKDRGGGGLLGKCPGLNVVSMTIHGDERSIMQNSYRVDQEALRAWMGMPTIYLAPGDDGEDRSTRSTPDQPPINHDVLIGQNTTSEGESTINRSNGGIICTCTDRSTIGETQADQHTSPSPHTPGDLSHGVRDRVCDDEVVDRTRWDDLAKPTSATETGRAPTRTARSRSTEMVDRGLIGG